MKKLSRFTICLLALIALPLSLSAAPLTDFMILAGTPLQGVQAARGPGVGLIDGPPGYAATNGGLVWSITQNADRTWHYVYTFSFNPTGTSPSGQVVFQSDLNLNSSNLSNYLVNLNLGSLGLISPATYSAALTGAPDSIYGYAFNFSATGVSTLSFDSSLVPTFGNLLFKGVVNGTTPILAYNVGFATPVSPQITSAEYVNYVVVPGLIQVATPEPSTWLILAALIGFLIYVKKPAGLLKPNLRA